MTAVTKYEAVRKELEKTEDVRSLSRESEQRLRKANARIFNFLPYCPEEARNVTQGKRTRTVAHD